MDRPDRDDDRRHDDSRNLGARVTGWGFVVFTLGSICGPWSGSRPADKSAGDQRLLTLVNLIGIWRWLGRQRAMKMRPVRQRSEPTLGAAHVFTATGITGLPVTASDGEVVGTVVEALVTCADGTVSYVVIRSGGVGGIGETLRAVARSDLDFGCKGFTLHHERTCSRRCLSSPMATGRGAPGGGHDARHAARRSSGHSVVVRLSVVTMPC
ncbi:PRC-barrel domain-containing protein [Sphingobium xenophagum]|uniref:PRC-barrel domain-containing protein n=1 Tax=Sphingobium xenophagum TaxID=121428 RepID=UPI001FD343CF|nr:PRC-barrel domain-containing protein [Sphingobium xenophagum]